MRNLRCCQWVLNSAILPKQFCKFSAGSHVLSSSGKPSHLTRYSRPPILIWSLVPMIPSISNSSSSTCSLSQSGTYLYIGPHYEAKTPKNRFPVVLIFRPHAQALGELSLSIRSVLIKELENQFINAVDS